MWHVITPEEAERQRKVQDEAILRAVEKAREKAEARKAFVESNTCPHCGQCPPVPPWLIG